MDGCDRNHPLPVVSLPTAPYPVPYRWGQIAQYLLTGKGYTRLLCFIGEPSKA